MFQCDWGPIFIGRNSNETILTYGEESAIISITANTTPVSVGTKLNLTSPSWSLKYISTLYSSLSFCVPSLCPPSFIQATLIFCCDILVTSILCFLYLSLPSPSHCGAKMLVKKQTSESSATPFGWNPTRLTWFQGLLGAAACLLPGQSLSMSPTA